MKYVQGMAMVFVLALSSGADANLPFFQFRRAVMMRFGAIGTSVGVTSYTMSQWWHRHRIQMQPNQPKKQPFGVKEVPKLPVSLLGWPSTK